MQKIRISAKNKTFTLGKDDGVLDYRCVYEDDEGRELLVVQSDQNIVAYPRYTDLDSETKDFIVELLCEFTDESREKIKKFLDFDEEDDEFCS